MWSLTLRLSAPGVKLCEDERGGKNVELTEEEEEQSRNCLTGPVVSVDLSFVDLS